MKSEKPITPNKVMNARKIVRTVLRLLIAFEFPIIAVVLVIVSIVLTIT